MGVTALSGLAVLSKLGLVLKGAALALMAEMEPEHCYKRIICAASTGQYYNQKLEYALRLVTEKEAELLAGKFVAAAQYGAKQGEVAKCEQRYDCSLDLDTIKLYF